MSQGLTLARPYARAAFAIARDEKTFADWSLVLGFAARIAADPQVATLLGDPRLSDGGAVTLLSPQDANPSFARFAKSAATAMVSTIHSDAATPIPPNVLRSTSSSSSFPGSFR